MALCLGTAWITFPLVTIFKRYQVALSKSTYSTQYGSAKWKQRYCHLCTARGQGLVTLTANKDQIPTKLLRRVFLSSEPTTYQRGTLVEHKEHARDQTLPRARGTCLHRSAQELPWGPDTLLLPKQSLFYLPGAAAFGQQQRT